MRRIETFFSFVSVKGQSLLIYKRANFNPLPNPVPLSVAILVVTKTPHQTYFDGAQFVQFLLGPAMDAGRAHLSPTRQVAACCDSDDWLLSASDTTLLPANAPAPSLTWRARALPMPLAATPMEKPRSAWSLIFRKLRTYFALMTP